MARLYVTFFDKFITFSKPAKNFKAHPENTG